MEPQVVVVVGGQPWEDSMFCANFCSGLVEEEVGVGNGLVVVGE